MATPGEVTAVADVGTAFVSTPGNVRDTADYARSATNAATSGFFAVMSIPIIILALIFLIVAGSLASDGKYADGLIWLGIAGGLLYMVRDVIFHKFAGRNH